MNEVPFQPESDPKPESEFHQHSPSNSPQNVAGNEESYLQESHSDPIDPVATAANGNDLTGFYPLHPDVIRADRIAGLIFFAVVALGMVIGLGVKLFTGAFDGLFFALFGGATVVAVWLLWMAIYWPKFEYRRTRWRLDDVGLEIHKGVLWRHRRVVPLARVQHADVGQGPLQRMYDLATLTVHTAGTQSSSVDLIGLHHQVALHLRDRLVRQKLPEENLATSTSPNLGPTVSSNVAEARLPVDRSAAREAETDLDE